MSFTEKDLIAGRAKVMQKADYHHRLGIGMSLQAQLVKEVEILHKRIAGAIGVAKPPGAKLYERAAPKVAEKHGGDWSQVNDLNRCTIVVRNDTDIQPAYIQVQKHFGHWRHDSMFIKADAKPTFADGNACGYSGYAVIVQTREGHRAEIQINYPNILFAKSPNELKDFPDLARPLRTKYAPVPGGLGHTMYEAYQDNKTRTGHAKACKLYYDYFRNPVPSSVMAELVLQALYPLNLHVPGVVIPPRPLYRGTGHSASAVLSQHIQHR